MIEKSLAPRHVGQLRLLRLAIEQTDIKLFLGGQFMKVEKIDIIKEDYERII